MKIVYVLTGGSLAGITAQTAALKVLENYGIMPVGIIGTSAGSLSGSFYACGMRPEEMVQIFSGMRKKDYIDPSWTKLIGAILTMGRGFTGLLEGKALYGWLQKNLPIENIQDTKIPLAINVTNVSKQIPETFRAGEIASAVRASTSIPFVFKPHKIGDSYYVDGGAVNNIPLDEAIRQFPDADAYLIITTLGHEMTEDPSDNSWIRKPFAAAPLLSRILHAAVRELGKDNMNSSGRIFAVAQVNPGDISLQEVDKFSAAYQTALKSAEISIKAALTSIGFFE